MVSKVNGLHHTPHKSAPEAILQPLYSGSTSHSTDGDEIVPEYGTMFDVFQVTPQHSCS